MSSFINTIEKTPTHVHETYCKNCPSFYGSDPESEDIARLPDGIRQAYVFPCAWRSEALCKGVCENLGYIESDHKELLLKNREGVK